jgi:hypothetical protein
MFMTASTHAYSRINTQASSSLCHLKSHINLICEKDHMGQEAGDWRLSWAYSKMFVRCVWAYSSTKSKYSEWNSMLSIS